MHILEEANKPGQRRRLYNAQFDVALGQRIRRLRLIRNMSQSDLAQLVKVTFQQIQKYELGRNRISAGSLFMIAQALETPVAMLMDGLEQHVKPTGPASVMEQSTHELLKEAQSRAEGLEMMKLFNAVESAEAREALRCLAVLFRSIPNQKAADAQLLQRTRRRVTDCTSDLPHHFSA